MSKTSLFCSMVTGICLYHISKHLLGMTVDLNAAFDSIYWVGGTLLIYHFIVEPA